MRRNRTTSRNVFGEVTLANSQPLFETPINAPRTDRTNVLVIGDLHAPFIKEGYLEFCQEVYRRYNCNEVVFIGDILDNHYSSFHTTDPDGHSAAEEFVRARCQISQWYTAFPNAKVCLGNHDLIPDRQAMNAGLSTGWIRHIGGRLNTPGWEYAERFVINDVQYVHGTGRKCRPRTKGDLMSTVQGHYHSESYAEWFVGQNFKVFAMQVGCGVDINSYAMAYGRHFNKPVIGCGVVLNDGNLPIVELMNL